MGTCCSKIDSKNECSSFNGVLHPSLEQWQAQISTCQFCQLNGVAGHVQCCMCDACQKSACSTPRYGAKGFVNGGSHHEPMRCSLCAADAYEAELHQASCVSCSQSSGPSDDGDMTRCDPMQSDRLTKQDVIQTDHSSLLQGHYAPKHDVLGHHYAMGYDLNMEEEGDFLAKHEDFMQGNYHASTTHDFLLKDSAHQTLFEPDHDDMLPSRILASSSKEGQDVIMFSNIAAYDFLSTSMRLTRSFNIDDSDGIKLEVRYKHMLPHDVQRSPVNYVSLGHDDHVLKRTRSSEKLLAGDFEANRSIRRRKSFQVDSADQLDLGYEHGELIMSELKNDDIDDDDDEFHDITVGVSISSLHTDHPGYTINGLPGNSEHCISMYPSHQSHGNIPMDMNLMVQDGLNFVANRLGVLNLDVSEFNQPVYLLSKENMQFISKEERAWEVRAEAMGMEDKVNRTQALSVVSTGDALLFSGANSDEFHLIPSMFVQHPKSPVLSPVQNLSPPRLMTNETDEQGPEKSGLSVDDIILLLENDELNEDDLFSLLIDSCTKSSPSSSPASSSSSSSSSEASMIWSSPLSSSTLSSSASSSTTSMPWTLPSSSTSMLQLPPSSTTYSSSLPYSLSLPASCKMSPHTSFEFKVKSCSSTPSTPVFSPIRSRTKRNIAQLKPNALTTGEIAEIWGLFEQRQAFVSKQCT